MATIVDAEITVSARLKRNGKYDFDHKSKYKEFGRLVFRSQKDEEYNMIFIIDEATKSLLRFLDTPNDAFWSRKGRCPAKDTPVHEGPFHPHTVSPYRLEVHNTNPELKRYYYMLRFYDKDDKIVRWDPIIDNTDRDHNFLHHAIAFLHRIVAFFLYQWDRTR